MADGLISSAQLEAVLYANMRFGVFLEGSGVLGAGSSPTCLPQDLQRPLLSG